MGWEHVQAVNESVLPGELKPVATIFAHHANYKTHISCPSVATVVRSLSGVTLLRNKNRTLQIDQSGRPICGKKIRELDRRAVQRKIRILEQLGILGRLEAPPANGHYGKAIHYYFRVEALELMNSIVRSAETCDSGTAGAEHKHDFETCDSTCDSGTAGGAIQPPVTCDSETTQPAIQTPPNSTYLKKHDDNARKRAPAPCAGVLPADAENKSFLKSTTTTAEPGTQRAFLFLLRQQPAKLERARDLAWAELMSKAPGVCTHADQQARETLINNQLELMLRDPRYRREFGLTA
jgi:hypothetical protein